MLFGKKEQKTTGERQQILEMLASGKITVEEAEKLLSAIGEGSAGIGASKAVEPLKGIVQGKAKFLRVVVCEDDGEKVDIRIPMQLIRAGVKLGSLIPKGLQSKIDDSLHEKGMQFSLSDMKPETIEELIDGLSEFSIDVNDGGDKVRIFCE